MASATEFGRCNVPKTQSSSNKHYSLGVRCSVMRQPYKAIKEGGKPKDYKLSKADIQRLENAGFEWKRRCNFETLMLS